MKRYTELITAESIKNALKDPNVKTRSQILQKIGTKSSSTYYKTLDRIAKENKIELPQIGNYRKNHEYHDKEKLRIAAETSNSIKEVLDKLSVDTTNYSGIKTAAEKFGIDLPRYKVTEMDRLKQQERIANKILTVCSRRINGARLKDVTFALGLLENKCLFCGLEEEWNGQPITLQIDHINGNNKDNRIENLRILCPNCHTQTDTFAGRNRN